MGQKIHLGCIADDFTGASDAASFLVSGGLKTLLVIWPNTGSVSFAEYDAIVVALKSRSVTAKEAIETSIDALNWLRSIGADRYYFKYCSTFDSTPAGNIGPVCDSVLEKFDAPYTLLCPALLSNGRTVRSDVLYVNGTPLAESHMKHHPLNPMWDSRISVLMSTQSRYPSIPISEKEYADPPKLRRKIDALTETHTHFYLVPDLFDPEHGRFLASFFSELPFCTGGSGLLEDIAAFSGTSHHGTTEERSEKDPYGRLLFSGSCSEMTQKQVSAYIASGGRTVVVEENTLEEHGAVHRLAQIYFAKPAQDILYCCSGSCGKRCSDSSPELSGRFENFLSALAEVITEHLAVHRIVIAGGETSGAIIKKLNLKGFRVGESVAPGVPILYPVGKEHLSIVLKSGNFGGEDFFLRTLEET